MIPRFYSIFCFLFVLAFAPYSDSAISATQCPKPFPGPAPTPEFVQPRTWDYQGPHYAKEEDILDYLNKYGAERFHAEYLKAKGKNWPGSIQAYRDLTNDGVPELAFDSGGFYIFGCKEGHYATLYEEGPDAFLHAPKIIQIIDANRNHLPEITVLLGFASQGGHSYQVIEWDGEQFRNILKSGDEWAADSIWVEATGDLEYGDYDRDGRIEYIANIGIPVWETYEYGIPWRQEKEIYKWNGRQFTLYRRIFSAPEYRFQAVQDGDRATREGDFNRALNFYRQAIYNDKLGGWSPERREYVRMKFFESFNAFKDTLTPVPPPPHIEEYDFLLSYSRFRIMLLYLSHGWISDARVIYNNLQKKYPDGKPGHIYAALAENVWTEFFQSRNLGKACEKAHEFAIQNKDTVYYYIGGSGFPGNHGIQYQSDPAWICPFE